MRAYSSARRGCRCSRRSCGSAVAARSSAAVTAVVGLVAAAASGGRPPPTPPGSCHQCPPAPLRSTSIVKPPALSAPTFLPGSLGSGSSFGLPDCMLGQRDLLKIKKYSLHLFKTVSHNIYGHQLILTIRYAPPLITQTQGSNNYSPSSLARTPSSPKPSKPTKPPSPTMLPSPHD